jgi:hypothetical protein
MAKKNIFIRFLPEFVESIKNTFVLLPTEAGRLNDNAYLIFRHISIYARMSQKSDFNLSVKSLLEQSNIPNYNEVMKGNRNIGDRIIAPLEKALDEIQNTLRGKFQWQFKNGVHNNWSDFENDYVCITLDKHIRNEYKQIEPPKKKELKSKAQ